MGWLDATADELAVEKAIKIAGRIPLPITARSLTAAEMRFRSRRPIVLGGLAFAPFALLTALLSANDPINAKVEMAAMVLAFAVIAWLGAPTV